MTSTALARATNETALASPGDFGQEHRRIVREFFCDGATEGEFEVLWAGAKSRHLDPVRKQIHFVSRWDDMRGKNVWSSQVSIDGFRAIAESTGKYDGQDEPTYETTDDGGVLVARVTVYRKDISRPFVGVARWEEFAQQKNGKPLFMWAKMPFHMLAKCAEALALRKAFPEQLAGLYAPEEMDQASNAPPVIRQVQQPKASAPAKPPTAAELATRAPNASADAAEEILRQAGKWPGVRATAYKRLLDLAQDPAEVEELRARYRSDLPDPAMVTKVDQHAERRLVEIDDANESPAAAGAREPGDD